MLYITAIEIVKRRPRTVYRWSQRESQPSIPAVIASCLRERSASEPQDKAFALYGILRKSQVEPPSPDYDLPLGVVYHGLYAALLKKYPSMIQLIVDSGMNTLDAPTWVPDWSAAFEKSWLPSKSIYRVMVSVFGATPSIEVSNIELKVAAKLIDRVVFTTGALPQSLESVKDSCQVADILHQWHLTCRRDVSVHRYFGVLADALWTAISAEDRHGTGFSGFDQWYKTIAEFPILNESITSAELPNHIARYLFQHNQVADFMSWCCEHLAGKRALFVSSTIVGTGPTSMTIGDHVAYIKGVKWPIVIRETADSKYQVVGPVVAMGLAD